MHDDTVIDDAPAADATAISLDPIPPPPPRERHPAREMRAVSLDELLADATSVERPARR